MNSRIIAFSLEELRRKIFWFLDFVRGQAIRKNYIDVKYLNTHYNDTLSESKRNQYLRELLSHASKTTEFYKQYIDAKNLQCFPVINKNVVRSNYSNFLSSTYTQDKLKKVTTSGSTGTPFSVYQDRRKVNRHIADNIFFNELANHNLGSRLYYFRIWTKMVKKSSFRKWMMNLKAIEANSTVGEYMKETLVKLSNDRSTKSFLAYSSTYDPLINLIDEKFDSKLDFNINSIIAMSDSLLDKTRSHLKERFKCPVILRYSNMENGFIAQQCIEENNEYHINTASFFLEILDRDTDYPVSHGDIGRIVVTDLFNYGMPLIRYDTGDLGIMLDDSKCSIKNPVLTEVMGRRADAIFDTTGVQVSQYIVTNTMWPYDQVLQFQFIQISTACYRMVLNTHGNAPIEESHLIKELKKYLGNDAEIQIKYVEEIPQLASGKRKYIVNEMKSGS